MSMRKLKHLTVTRLVMSGALLLAAAIAVPAAWAEDEENPANITARWRRR